MKSVLAAIAALVMCAGAADAVKSPDWWQNNRAIYCPFAASGAGSALLKMPSQGITERMKSFEDLPLVLDDARRFGCNVVYLVDYWEGGYEMKSEYVPRSDLGGPEAFKKGIQALHEAGGKIIIYLEAFIVSRRTEWAKKHSDWAMMDEDGKFYSYYDTGDRFYLMYPGPGSGWREYISDLARDMVSKYDVDGIVLDSYGYQWDWIDYNPSHPAGLDKTVWNKYAVKLVQDVRRKVQEVKPDAIVMLEGDEFTPLLDVCDGAMDESLEIILRKPWAAERKYNIYTNHFSVRELKQILDAGYNIALTPYWFAGFPDAEKVRKQAEPMKRRRWVSNYQTLVHWDNILAANGVDSPPLADFHKLWKEMERASWGVDDDDTLSVPRYYELARSYAPLLEKLRKKGESSIKMPPDYIKSILASAGK